MKSADPRKIEINNPVLRNIRVNFRKLIKAAYTSKFNQLLKLVDIYREKYIQGNITPSQQKRWFDISRESDKLMHAYNRSICQCSSGATCISLKKLVKEKKLTPSERPIDLDMVWVPHYYAWFCINCYEEYYKLKICENCRETDETMVKITECSICKTYICELCKHTCLECEQSFCDQCYPEHLRLGVGCSLILENKSSK